MASSSDRVPRRPTVWPGEDVELVDGSRLFVRHAEPAGPGLPPALLVHGLGGSSLNWIALMDELIDVFDQWAPDLPGFGESPPARRHTVGSYVRVLVEYIERFSGPVHVVANSMGGLISVMLAATRGDLVSSLTLLSPAMPSLKLPSVARGMAVLAMPRVGERLLARINNVPPEEQVRRLADVMFGDPSLIDPDGFQLVVDERARRMKHEHGDAVLLESLRSIVRHYVVPPRRSAWAAATRVKCPTLVILGRRDPIVGVATAAKWQRTVSHATVVTLPTAGHVAMMEQPSVVASLIREHVR